MFGRRKGETARASSVKPGCDLVDFRRGTDLDEWGVDELEWRCSNGSQFRSRKFHRALTRHRLVGSMGQVASAADNAAMESFFSLLQKNVLDRQPWRTREDLRIRIVTWIERTYHRRRRQDALGRLTPIEYEAIMTSTATQAA
jgi:transposase InsO family protein